MIVRPDLEGRTLQPVKPVTYHGGRRNRDPGLSDASCRQGPARSCRPSSLPHGGPSARDEWGFDWLAQFLAARGYAVIQPQLSRLGRLWRRLARTKTASGTGGPRSATSPPRPIGWPSQGIADPATTGDRRLVLRRLCRAAVRGDRADLVQGGGRDRAGHRPRAAEAARRGTSPIAELVSGFVGSGPHIAGRFAAAARVGDQGAGAAGPRRSGRQRRIAHIAEDERRACRSAGKQSELLTFDGLDHQLDDSDARTQMLTKIGELLDRTIGH